MRTPELASTLSRQDVAGWIMQEKHDGVRGCWTGSELLTRNGNPISAPAWWLAELPPIALDGELWIGRGMLQAVASVVRSRAASDARWSTVRYMVFDAPDHSGTYIERMDYATQAVAGSRNACAIPHEVCAGRMHAISRSRKIAAEGGEGVALHNPDALHAPGRSGNLLRCVPVSTAEARVISYRPTACGVSLWCADPAIEFALRCSCELPPIGALVTYQFSGRTDSGAPRSAAFVAVRDYE